MIDLARLEKIISARFGAVSHVSDTVIRAQETYNNRAIAVHLFDASDAVAGAEFDLGQFQNRFVRDEFYRISGSLQWNLYCYLICNDLAYKRIVSDGRAFVIERDHQYARKLVRTMEQIEREFTDRRVQQTAKIGIPGDLGVLWENECEKAGLSILTSHQPFEVIVAVIEDRSAPPPQVAKPPFHSPGSGDVTVGRIDSIKPVSFREKINGRKFEFGDVNLIHGPNGAGKTSILEAIEAWMCGGSFRNQKGNPAFNGVELQLKETRSVVPGPIDDLQLYRARERHWFHVNQRRGVHLPQSFARFNFFHADSAARLELAPDPDSTTTALNDLVLGEETSRLRLQFEELLKRLNRRIRECEDMRKQSIEQRNRAKESIAKVSRPSTDTAAIGASLVSKISQVGWRGSSSIASLEERSQLVSQLTEAATIVENCLRNSESIPFVSESELLAQIQTVEAHLSTHDGLQSDLRGLQGTEKAAQERISSVKSKLHSLERLLQYYDQGGIRLWNVVQREQTAQEKSIALEAALSAVKRENIASLMNLGGTLENCYNETERAHRDAQSSLMKATNRLSEAKQLAGRLEALASDSLSAALDYVSSDKSICRCPVCLAPYTHDKLLDLIKEPRLNPLAEQLKPLQGEFAHAQATSKSISEQLAALTAIRESVGLLSSAKQSGTTLLREVLNSVDQWQSYVQESKNQLEAIIQDTAALEQSGFSTVELHQVFGVMSEYAPSGATVQREAVQAVVDDLSKRIAADQEVLATSAHQRGELETKAAEVSDYLLSDASSIETVRARFSRLKEAATSMADIHARVNFSTDDQLKNIMLQLKNMASQVESFNRLSQELTSVAQAVERFGLEQKKALEAIEFQTRKIEALQKAIDLITRIQAEHNPQKTLSDFLRATQCQIGDLFRVIHAPQEFDGIFIDDEGSILLQRTGGLGIHRISEVSSGQRSALGIALFLTLNGLADKAPPVILLDDPIAHVDDLNILAFFDCIRELAMESKRQVFFATASNKAAGLFRKKFDFLGDERFRVHELQP